MDEDMKKEIDELYNDLREIQKDIKKNINEKIAGVFETYKGPDYRKENPCRCMIIGKDAYEWNEGDTAEEFVDNRLIPDKPKNGLERYTSPFWTFIRQLSQGLNGENINDDNEESRRKAFYRVVWSNLTKISVNSESPPKDVLKKQRKICIELIRKEIKYYEPTHLVFCVGTDYWDMVKEVLNIENVEEEHYQDICELKAPEYAPVVFWTRHPERWAGLPSMGRDDAIKTILESKNT